MERDRDVRIADELLAAWDAGTIIAPLAARYAPFDEAAAYAVSALLRSRREAAGWRAVGRKMGFTNRTIWPRYGVAGPMWAPVYDRTMAFAIGDRATVSLAGLVQPRLEPEVAVRFRCPPASEDPRSILDAIEWIAPSFELVHCHFDGWKFAFEDTVADFGLHGLLVVGTPVPMTDHTAEHWLRGLESARVVLRRGDALVDQGEARNVLGGPLHALGHLVRMLSGQPGFAPLAAGEIVTTGTITDAAPVRRGEEWRSVYEGLPLRGLQLRLET